MKGHDYKIIPICGKEYDALLDTCWNCKGQCAHTGPHQFSDDGLIEWCLDCGQVAVDHHQRKFGTPHPNS